MMVRYMLLFQRIHLSNVMINLLIILKVVQNCLHHVSEEASIFSGYVSADLTLDNLDSSHRGKKLDVFSQTRFTKKKVAKV